MCRGFHKTFQGRKIKVESPVRCRYRTELKLCCVSPEIISKMSLSLTARTMQRDLSELKELGLITTEGTARGRFVVWILAR